MFFAGNGCGDYYCYHADADGVIDEDAIYIWEHEEYCWKKVASGMAELLTRYYRDEI
ncbi:MAG: SMI1/KNR4 family protein [Eubacteriales bacterium]